MNEIASYILAYLIVVIMSKFILSCVNYHAIDIENDIREIVMKSPLVGLVLPIVLWPIMTICTAMMFVHFVILKIVNWLLR
jgi:hypothetical protein